MWSEIQPDFVKIDRHFIDGIAEDKLKHHFVKAMQNLAESCSAKIVAEGIENEADCLAVRDLGIALGQGYLIAMPESEPRTLPSEKAHPPDQESWRRRLPGRHFRQPEM